MIRICVCAGASYTRDFTGTVPIRSHSPFSIYVLVSPSPPSFNCKSNWTWIKVHIVMFILQQIMNRNDIYGVSSSTQLCILVVALWINISEAISCLFDFLQERKKTSRVYIAAKMQVTCSLLNTQGWKPWSKTPTYK